MATTAPPRPSAPAAGDRSGVVPASYLAPDLIIRGRIDTPGCVEIAGLVEGDVHAGRAVVLAAGRVRATLDADDAVVSGNFAGIIKARSVTFTDGCQFVGDIQYESLGCEPEANLDATFVPVVGVDARAHVAGVTVTTHPAPAASGGQAAGPEASARSTATAAPTPTPTPTPTSHRRPWLVVLGWLLLLAVAFTIGVAYVSPMTKDWRGGLLEALREGREAVGGPAATPSGPTATPSDPDGPTDGSNTLDEAPGDAGPPAPVVPAETGDSRPTKKPVPTATAPVDAAPAVVAPGEPASADGPSLAPPPAAPIVPAERVKPADGGTSRAEPPAPTAPSQPPVVRDPAPVTPPAAPPLDRAPTVPKPSATPADATPAIPPDSAPAAVPPPAAPPLAAPAVPPAPGVAAPVEPTGPDREIDPVPPKPVAEKPQPPAAEPEASEPSPADPVAQPATPEPVEPAKPAAPNGASEDGCSWVQQCDDDTGRCVSVRECRGR